MPKFTTGQPGRRRRALAACGVAVASGALLAACSSGSGSASGAAASSGSASGSPINIGYIGDMSGTPESRPSVPNAGVIATQAINAAGGINGHSLTLVTCDTHSDATATLACARKLVQDDHIVALIGGEGSDGVADLLKSAGVVDWMAIGNAPEDDESSLAYETALNGVAGWTESMYLGIKKFQPKKVAYLSIQGFDSYFSEAEKVAKANGVQVELVDVPLTATDFSPYIQKIKDSGAQAWGLVSFDTSAVVNAAVQGGLKLPLFMSDLTIDAAAIKAISAAPFPNAIAMEKLEDPAKSKVWATYLAELKQYDPNGTKVVAPTDATATNVWFGVYSFAKIAAALPSVTAQAFADKVKTISAFSYDLMPTLNFTAPGPISGLATQFDVSAYEGTYKGGKSVVVDSTPFSSFDNRFHSTVITPYGA
jgi:branched-chain amino acid transport system substrate-binding protein